MTTSSPIPADPLRTAAGGGRHDTTDRARGERDHEQADARWLYVWSYDALRPTGELLPPRAWPARRLPSTGRVGRVSPSHSTPPHLPP